jgi:hypothetical protein
MQQEEQDRMPEIISNKDRLRWHGRRMFFVVSSLRLHRRLRRHDRQPPVLSGPLPARQPCPT